MHFAVIMEVYDESNPLHKRCKTKMDGPKCEHFVIKDHDKKSWTTWDGEKPLAFVTDTKPGGLLLALCARFDPIDFPTMKTLRQFKSAVGQGVIRKQGGFGHSSGSNSWSGGLGTHRWTSINKDFPMASFGPYSRNKKLDATTFAKRAAPVIAAGHMAERALAYVCGNNIYARTVDSVTNAYDYELNNEATSLCAAFPSFQKVLRHFPTVTLNIDVSTKLHRDFDVGYTLLSHGLEHYESKDTDPALGTFVFELAKVIAPHYPGSLIFYNGAKIAHFQTVEKETSAKQSLVGIGCYCARSLATNISSTKEFIEARLKETKVLGEESKRLKPLCFCERECACIIVGKSVCECGLGRMISCSATVVNDGKSDYCACVNRTTLNLGCFLLNAKLNRGPCVVSGTTSDASLVRRSCLR
jgi:hypothetical protein